MPKNKYDNTLMKTAMLWAEESYCNKKKVGAVLTKNGRPLNSGYNGSLSKQDNQCEHTEYICNNCGNVVKDTSEFFIESIDHIDTREKSFTICCRSCRVPLFVKTIPYSQIVSLRLQDLSPSSLNILAEENKTKNITIKIVTSPFTIHAEANLILYATKHGIPTKGCSVYTTLSPCVECSKMMVASGITEVVYKDTYKDISGIDYLKQCGVEVRQLKVK